VSVLIRARPGVIMDPLSVPSKTVVLTDTTPAFQTRTVFTPGKAKARDLSIRLMSAWA